MPSPALLEWCTSSFTSIRHSFQQRVSNFIKPEVETPPCIAAFQSIKGKTPGDKKKYLNLIVDTIIENAKSNDKFSLQDELAGFPPFLTDVIKIHLGVKMKNDDLIVEGFKSRDISIVKRAMSCNWFFNGTRNKVNVAYFMDEIIPFVSLSSRSIIVRKLSHGLVGHETKAESFFTKFVESYGIEENVNLLVACSENFIFDTILKYKIHLPVYLVNKLYEKYPNLVVRYLHLGNKWNADNVVDRKSHHIRINDYSSFLPKLIRKHSEDFLKLFQLTPEKELKLNVAQSKLFIQKCKSVIIKKPEIFLKLVPIKLFQNSLNEQEFEDTMENLLPKDITDFHLETILEFIEASPKSNVVQLAKEKFKKKYGKNLLDHDPCFSSTRLLRTLSRTALESRVRLVLNKANETNTETYDLYLSLLPPQESIYILKNKIAKTLRTDLKIQLVKRMITCCRMYNDKENLVEVLKYFRDRHKNEQNFALCCLFEFLKEEFDLKSLDDAHWTVIEDLIDNAYAKGELLKEHLTLIESVLEGALRNALANNASSVDKILHIIVEHKMENFLSSWNVLKENQAWEQECLDQFFTIIPQKYPEDHHIWSDENAKLAILLSITKSVDSFNDRHARRRKSNCSGERQEPMKIENYPWLLKLTEELFFKSKTGLREERILRSIKRNAPEFYESMANEFVKVRDFKSGDALALLKRNPGKILENHSEYLCEARKLLRSANERDHRERRAEIRAVERFVLRTKWFQDIPVKFVEQCLSELRKEGSVQVLGILLSGETFEKVTEPLVPREKEVNSRETTETVSMILRSMRYTNPILSLKGLQRFLAWDYSERAEETLFKLSQHTKVNESIEFAGRLMQEPNVVTKKLGIRLMQRVATRTQLIEFLKNAWTKEADLSVRQMISKMIYNIFIQSPDTESWDLMKNCIDGFTSYDCEVIGKLFNIEQLNSSYLSDYIERYLDKIEELFNSSMNFRWRATCICLLIESIDENLMHHLSDGVSSMILKRYFCDIDSAEISQVSRIFIIRNYLLPATTKFEARLKNVMDVLKSTMKQFDRAHPKRKRFYPSNYTIQEFFSDLIKEIPCNKSERNLQIIASMIDWLNSNIAPWQEPSAHLSMNLYKEYLLSHSPEDFGARCARRIREFVGDFSGNIPISDISDCLQNFIYYKIFRDIRNPLVLKLNVIEGLIRGDDHFGVLTSLNLLDPDEVVDYDEKYDKIIAKIRKTKNATVQYYLFQHVNRIRDNDDNSAI